MDNLRLYITSINRSFVRQKKIFFDIAEIVLEIFQINKRKTALNQSLKINRQKLEMKREVINSSIYNPGKNSIDFVR